MALGSRRFGLMLFRLQALIAAALVKSDMAKGQPGVPERLFPEPELKLKGSRTYPTLVPGAAPFGHVPTSPVTGSAAPHTTGRVVAGSKMVSFRKVRPSRSLLEEGFVASKS